MRLDKWLWCARFYKTRQLAHEAIRTGKVKIKGERIKPSRLIKPGEALTVKQGPYRRDLIIRALSKNRRPAVEAEKLYEEKPESVEARQVLAYQLRMNTQMLPDTRGRPGKRNRRKIIRFTRRFD